MPLLDQAAKWTTNKMPKVITPKAHAIIDYAVAASFFGMAAFFWRRNKRAAVSALVCGAAETITALCTDYPGGVVKEITYETHGTIDFGLSGMVASLPDMLRFQRRAGIPLLQNAGARLGHCDWPHRLHRQRRRRTVGRTG